MKSIYRRIVFTSLVPWLISVPALAETDKPVRAVTRGSNNIVNSKVPQWRASGVIGQSVKNAEDQMIDEVEDLIVNMKTGEILAVVISSGGFLGIADTLSSIPVSALRFDTVAKAFKTRLTKEQLIGAPQFKQQEWPDYSDEATMQTLRSYRDTIGGDVTANDNSAQNEKLKNRKVMIPTDQGTSDKDIQITKDIRSAIVAADLSFNAKNIKIITKDEHVYLKGVVSDHAEHESVLKISKNHANAAKITDDLKVEAN